MMRPTEGAGFKLAATAIIWGFATGMLGICIPLVSMTDSGVILPLTVIIGASLTTVVVWLSLSRVPRRTLELLSDIESLKAQQTILEAVDKNIDKHDTIKLLEPTENS